jgi:cation-transporting P-type ATPase 13A2
LKCFKYRLYTYYFDEVDQLYRPIQFSVNRKKHADILAAMANGLESKELWEQRFITYGKNSTKVPEKNSITIIIDEILSPFYIFQVKISYKTQSQALQLYPLGKI